MESDPAVGSVIDEDKVKISSLSCSSSGLWIIVSPISHNKIKTIYFKKMNKKNVFIISILKLQRRETFLE